MKQCQFTLINKEVQKDFVTKYEPHAIIQFQEDDKLVTLECLVLTQTIEDLPC